MTATPRMIDFQNVADPAMGSPEELAEQIPDPGKTEPTSKELRRARVLEYRRLEQERESGPEWEARRQLGDPNAPRTVDGLLLTEKQIRARMRRKAKRGELATPEEYAVLQSKPMEQWDLEELARGRPRGPKGTFRGPTPKWISREVHEKAMDRFKAAIRTGMNVSTVGALDAISLILNNDDVDDKGKPVVPAGTKLDAAKFLLEHVVGKPTQRIESDVSVKLQGILAQVMVNPDNPELKGMYSVGHLPGVTMPMATADDILLAEEEDDDFFSNDDKRN